MKTPHQITAQRLLYPTLLAAAALLSACATNPIALDTVGPKPAKSISMKGIGSAVVYTATEPRYLDKTIPYYVHSSYTIKNPDGHQFKWVENHNGDMDQAPQTVSLPAGNYLIHAQSADYGLIDIPVVIGAMQLTEVYLDGTWARHQHDTAGTNLVRLPNGRVVGWSALASR